VFLDLLMSLPEQIDQVLITTPVVTDCLAGAVKTTAGCPVRIRMAGGTSAQPRHEQNKSQAFPA
jgi:hypothetical protein